MPLQIGYIDSDGHPKITIRVQATNPGVVVDVDALVDTGFTGFLMLPIAQALPLGLALIGTGDYTLADGSRITNFLARGTVTVGPSVPPAPGNPHQFTSSPDYTDETVEGIVVLCGDDPLIGMEFIKSLDKMLVVGKLVALVEDTFRPSDHKSNPLEFSN